MGGAAGGGDAFEVGVVVQHDEAGGEGGGGDDEVGDGHAMLTVPGELVLQVDRGGHDLGGDRGGVEAVPLLKDRLVVAEVAAAVEDFEIDDGAGGELAVFEQR